MTKHTQGTREELAKMLPGKNNLEQIIRGKLILPNMLAGGSYETEVENLRDTVNNILSESVESLTKQEASDEDLKIFFLEHIPKLIAEWHSRPRFGEGSDCSDLMTKLRTSLKEKFFILRREP